MLMVLQVLILMALVVLLFDWVGMLLFEDWGCGSTHGHSPASHHINSLPLVLVVVMKSKELKTSRSILMLIL